MFNSQIEFRGKEANWEYYAYVEQTEITAFSFLVMICAAQNHVETKGLWSKRTKSSLELNRNSAVGEFILEFTSSSAGLIYSVWQKDSGSKYQMVQ